METGDHNRKPRWKLWVALAGISLAVIVFGFGVYRYRWDDGVTRIVTRMVPYPAAIIDGHVIRYADFQEDVRLLKNFYEAEKARAVAGSIFPTEEEIRERVLDRLIKDRLVVKLASRYKIAITTNDVKASYESTILDQSALGTPSEKARAEARAEQTLGDLYGMSSTQFKTKILHPFLVRQKLKEVIQNDEELNAEKLKKVEEALAAVRGGLDFNEAVLIYSEDQNTLNTEGDRGMIGRGLLPPEVEEAAFAMDPGEDGALSGIVQSVFGYHILKVTDRQMTDDHVTHVRLYEILIKPIQLDDYLEAQKKRVSIITFIQ